MESVIHDLEEKASRARQSPAVQERMTEILERRRSGSETIALSTEEAEKVCRAFAQ